MGAGRATGAQKGGHVRNTWVCAEEIGRGVRTQDTRKLLRIRGMVMPFLWNRPFTQQRREHASCCVIELKNCTPFLLQEGTSNFGIGLLFITC